MVVILVRSVNVSVDNFLCYIVQCPYHACVCNCVMEGIGEIDCIACEI